MHHQDHLPTSVEPSQCGTGYNEAGATMPVHCTSDMMNFEELVVLVLLLTLDNRVMASRHCELA